MDPDSLEKIMTNPFLIGLGSSSRALVSALLICGGAQLFDFKNFYSFFTKRKVIGLFLLILGVRFLISVLSFTTPFDYVQVNSKVGRGISNCSRAF